VSDEKSFRRRLFGCEKLIVLTIFALKGMKR
jgi:hypothetical protein